MKWWRMIRPRRRTDKHSPWVVVTLIDAVWLSGGDARISGILVGTDKIGIAIETSERDTHFVPWRNVSDVRAEREVIDP